MFIRKDKKVRAELVFDNGTTACYHATWDKGSNRFTACSSARFNKEFRSEEG